MKKTLLFLIVAMTSISCDDECIGENTKLGDRSLSENSLELIKYQDSETLTFKNYNNVTRVFNIQKSITEGPRICTKVLCRPTYELEGSNGCEFFDTPLIGYLLSSDSLSIEIIQGIALNTAETTEFYDYASFKLKSPSDSLLTGLVTEQYFDTPALTTSALEFNLLTNTSLNQVPSLDFPLKYLSYIEGNNESFFLFNKPSGILGFRIENETWLLVE